jgi:hypothetical protein
MALPLPSSSRLCPVPLPFHFDAYSIACIFKETPLIYELKPPEPSAGLSALLTAGRAFLYDPLPTQFVDRQPLRHTIAHTILSMHKQFIL